MSATPTDLGEILDRAAGALDTALTALKQAKLREEHLLNLLTTVTVAADSLQEQWAEAGKAERNRLWRELAAATDVAGDEVYPLRGWDPDVDGPLA